MDPAERGVAKMDLAEETRLLMPEGRPDFLGMVKYPKLTELVDAYGRATVMKLLFVLIKSLCDSLNVVRNMTEDQMIEAAAFLMDEAGNFRLQDYTVMFALMKRGGLVKILDRLDIQVLGQALEAYWEQRHQVGQRAQEEEAAHYDTLGNASRSAEGMNPLDQLLNQGLNGLMGGIEGLRNLAATTRPPEGPTAAEIAAFRVTEFNQKQGGAHGH